MRIKSGTTDQYIYFVAVDDTDFSTRETGLTGFSVVRSRNGSAITSMTSPSVLEMSAGSAPGVYRLLLDEDMTMTAGNDTEEMIFHITHASMAPVTRTIELFRNNVDAISGSTTAADNLEASTAGIVATSVDDTGATTTQFALDVTETTNDHYNGRIIVFTSGNLTNQATLITDYDGTTKDVTVETLTEAPANNDTLVIV